MYDELRGNLMAQATHFSVHDETSLLLLKAADAIEDLQKQLQKSEVDNINLTGWLAEEHAKAEDFENKLNLWRQGKISRWIPVTERLPEEEEVVLVWGGASVYTAKRHNKYGELMWWKLNSKQHYCNPTHWMPLPEPPKDDET